MKKYLLLFGFLFTFIHASKASHVWGGTIYWECLTNGQYQFFMEVYRDCTGIGYIFDDETLTIFGNPLPKDSLGNAFSTIELKPDSIKWLNLNLGDISPTCESQYGTQYSCDNSDLGSVQQFFYKSKPFKMEGVPPSDGWRFYWERLCCRPTEIENVNIPSTSYLLLHAIMYPTIYSDLIDSCFYSSPKFISPPTTTICLGENTYNNIGIQREGDSISFSWSRPYIPPVYSPDTLSYNLGYAYTNPTPDKSFDIRNKASSLNQITGNIELTIHSYFDNNNYSNNKYINVVQVDSWRDRKIVATTYRELPLQVVDCPVLQNNSVNNKPELYLNNKKQRNISINVEAGTKINFPIQVIDNDTTGVGTNNQMVIFKPYGQLFSTDYIDTTACDFPPCAILKNTSPTYDTSELGYTIKNQKTLSTTFEWQTNCSHLDRNGMSKSYLIYYKAQDDHCPIPQSVSGVIRITVHPNNSFTKPRMNCLSESNGVNQISWQSSSIDTVRFEQLYIYGTNNAGSNFTLIDSISNPLLQSYTDNSSNGYKYYYIQSKNISCSSVSSYSKNSDTITTSTDSLKIESLLECIQLSWTEVRSSYGDQENRKYLVYREHPIGSGFQLIDSVINDISYCDDFVSCGTKVRYLVKGDNNSAVCNFRVDTVEINTRKSSSSPPLVQELNHSLQALDTLGFYQWFDCLANKIIIGETNRSFTPKDTGLFSVIITHFGCSDTSTCIPFFPVGLPEPAFKDEVLLYPNPTTGLIQIKLGKTTKEVNVLVRNIQGQMLQEKLIVNSQSFQLELPEQAGIYFIQLTNEKGERANLKVVKQ